MKIELRYDDGVIRIEAKHPWLDTVATGQGKTLEEAVKSLVIMFAEMQAETIAALNASGLVRYVSAAKEDQVPS